MLTSMEVSHKPTNRSSGCGIAVLVGLALFWIIPFACLRQLPVLTASISPGDSARTAALVSGLSQIALIGIPVLGLAFLLKDSPIQSIIRSWLVAVIIGLVLLPVHFIPEIATQLQMIAQSIILMTIVCVLLVTNRRASADQPEPIHSATSDRNGGRQLFIPILFLASATGLVLTYPWIFIGALGSITDTILAFVLGVLLGLTSTLIFDRFVNQSLQRNPELFRITRLGYGGIATAGVLAILSSATAFPFGAIQIFLLISLSGLGWAISSLGQIDPSAATIKRILPGSLLTGIAGGAVLAFLDPEEMTLVLAFAPGELLPQAFGAALITFLLSLFCSAAYTLLISTKILSQGNCSTLGILSSILIGATGIGAAILYYNSQPGLHGDRMFVILSEQADLSNTAAISDPMSRRQAVFDRLVQHAGATQAPLLTGLDRLGVSYTSYYLVNAVEIEDSPTARLWLISRDDVDRILSSPVLRPLRSEPSEQPGTSDMLVPDHDWNLLMIGVPRVWDELGVTGSGILVGQSDSGVQGDHPELQDSYRGRDGLGDSWFDPWFSTEDPTDLGGHGTHTLGTVLGNRVGVAPDAQWIGCVNLARNLGNPALYLDCWQFNLAPFSQQSDSSKEGNPLRGAHVLNNSWGCPEIEGCDTETFSSAVHALRAAGVFVVVSAGNDGPTCGSLIVPPPTHEEVLSVGAIDRSGNLAAFSSIGLDPAAGGIVKPDLVAPGLNVFSSLPGSTYGFNSGTSMAGPHVAGVVALMWSANPDLIGDIDQTEQILIETVKPYTGNLPNCPGVNGTPSTAYGYGIVDAFAAVQASLALR